MELRLENALIRLAQADLALTGRDRGPDTFVLMYTGDGAQMLHGGWDPSWAMPTEHEVDDLVELGHLRLLNPVHGRGRTFALSVRGRQAGQALIDSLRVPLPPAGRRAPNALDTIRWLVEVEAQTPGLLDPPVRLLDAAVDEGLIERDGGEALAQRIIELVRQGHLAASLPDFEHVSATQLLQDLDLLSITVKGHEAARDGRPSGAATVNVFTSVVDSQIAMGNITNVKSFIDVLVTAEQRVDDLVDVPPDAKEEAKGLLAKMRGSAATAGGAVVTEAGAQLVAGVLAKLVGVPLV